MASMLLYVVTILAIVLAPCLVGTTRSFWMGCLGFDLQHNADGTHASEAAIAIWLGVLVQAAGVIAVSRDTNIEPDRVNGSGIEIAFENAEYRKEADEARQEWAAARFAYLLFTAATLAAITVMHRARATGDKMLAA